MTWPFPSGRCRAATPGPAGRSGRRRHRRWSAARTGRAARWCCRTLRVRTAASTPASRSSPSDAWPDSTLPMSAPRVPDELAAAIGVELDPQLLRRALTHRSYAYEHGGLPHNERLEFLGDAVLGIVVTETLYRGHPDLSEGKLAKLRASVVNMRALAGVARSIGPNGLGAYILLGRGEEATGGRDKSSILADTLEAVFGAVYLEHSLAVAGRVIH